MSSIFWLGRRAVIGMSPRSQTALNIRATGECVINLPSADLVDAVDRLALTTGRNPVSERKASVGYRYEPDKFGVAGLTPVPSDLVHPFRVAECAVNLEARLVVDHRSDADADSMRPMELEIVRTHVHPRIRSDEGMQRVDPDAWRPLIMSFQHFYGVGERLHPSRLATIGEEWYR
ncbi:flavin reductase family protein [Pseudolysinimonas kribbensis]|uniref:flavin reductase family protein n=1 Tax=Pseudolysinimonas kribbensis TaxID=433641 RepID=UPI0031E28665